MEDIFALADELGPLKVIHFQEQSIGLKGLLVVHNVPKGRSIGGIRMAPDVTTGECARLARAMTFKNAAAGLPHGGGKAVLVGDPKMPKEQKQVLIRGLANALREVEQYIFAPDMGTDEECMAWIKDEVDRVVALPREVGGIPLDEIGATGFGLSHVVDVAQEFCSCPTAGARIAVQGFGAVGVQAGRGVFARRREGDIPRGQGRAQGPLGITRGCRWCNGCWHPVAGRPGQFHEPGLDLLDVLPQLEQRRGAPLARPPWQHRRAGCAPDVGGASATVPSAAHRLPRGVRIGAGR